MQIKQVYDKVAELMDENKKQTPYIPLLVVVLLVLAFVSGTLWQKVKTLEKNSVTAVARTNNNQGEVSGEQESKLSVNNLKKYASDLKLDTGKFNKCLDSGEKKAEVDKQTGEGASEGVNGTPAIFLNGHLISGALPFDIFKTLIDYELSTGFDSGALPPENVQKLIDQGYISKEKKEPSTTNSPSKGAQNAKILLVEYSDFECPFCAKVVPTVNQIMDAYPNDIRLVFRQYPLPMHPSAPKAAEASLCALDQGKFWEYHDKLFGVN